MKEVYCKNCEFEHGTFACYWDALLLLKEEITKIEIKKYLNDECNCIYYKRKWRKFWLSK